MTVLIAIYMCGVAEFATLSFSGCCFADASLPVMKCTDVWKQFFSQLNWLWNMLKHQNLSRTFQVLLWKRSHERVCAGNPSYLCWTIRVSCSVSIRFRKNVNHDYVREEFRSEGLGLDTKATLIYCTRITGFQSLCWWQLQADLDIYWLGVLPVQL